ncbi:MAG: DUF4870 domain-containing protein [Pirellulaceae bacterium]
MNPNTIAMACHLCGLLGYLGNGFGSIVGPLIIWILKKDEFEAVDEHGKEALNFNISVVLYGAILFAFAFVTFGIGLLIVIPLGIALAVFHIICTIIAAMKANEGRMYRYPLCLRLVK